MKWFAFSGVHLSTTTRVEVPLKLMAVVGEAIFFYKSSKAAIPAAPSKLVGFNSGVCIRRAMAGSYEMVGPPAHPSTSAGDLAGRRCRVGMA